MRRSRSTGVHWLRASACALLAGSLLLVAPESASAAGRHGHGRPGDAGAAADHAGRGSDKGQSARADKGRNARADKGRSARADRGRSARADKGRSARGEQVRAERAGDAPEAERTRTGRYHAADGSGRGEPRGRRAGDQAQEPEAGPLPFRRASLGAAPGPPAPAADPPEEDTPPAGGDGGDPPPTSTPPASDPPPSGETAVLTGTASGAGDDTVEQPPTPPTAPAAPPPADPGPGAADPDDVDLPEPDGSTATATEEETQASDAVSDRITGIGLDPLILASLGFLILARALRRPTHDPDDHETQL